MWATALIGGIGPSWRCGRPPWFATSRHPTAGLSPGAGLATRSRGRPGPPRTAWRGHGGRLPPACLGRGGERRVLVEADGARLAMPHDPPPAARDGATAL